MIVSEKFMEKLLKIYLADAKLSFKQREQIVLDLLVNGMSIDNIANLLDCEPNFVQLISEAAIENYVPPWVK